MLTILKLRLTYHKVYINIYRVSEDLGKDRPNLFGSSSKTQVGLFFRLPCWTPEGYLLITHEFKYIYMIELLLQTNGIFYFRALPLLSSFRLLRFGGETAPQGIAVPFIPMAFLTSQFGIVL